MDDNYQPFNEAGTMLPPSPEMMEELQYEESTYAEQDAKAVDLADHLEPVQDNPDDGYFNPAGQALPRYYITRKVDGWVKAITRTEYGKLRYEQLTVRHQRVPMCGHKFVPEHEPRHRNCESCWFTFFNVYGQLTQAVEEVFQKHGKNVVVGLRGPKFFENWLKFMSTVANLKLAQEARSQEIKDSFIPPPAQQEIQEDGSTSGTEQDSGEDAILAVEEGSEPGYGAYDDEDPSGADDSSQEGLVQAVGQGVGTAQHAVQDDQ